MTAAVLMHPDVSASAVGPFRNSRVEMQSGDRLDGDKEYSAALIFGGDGTVHRHLPQLYKQQIPMLVVPRGSGNDFAKALGIKNEQTALEAWRHFCAQGDNVREIDLGVIKPADGEEILVLLRGRRGNGRGRQRSRQ